MVELFYADGCLMLSRSKDKCIMSTLPYGKILRLRMMERSAKILEYICTVVQTSQFI